jgi:methylglyoxal synthase
MDLAGGSVILRTIIFIITSALPYYPQYSVGTRGEDIEKSVAIYVSAIGSPPAGIDQNSAPSLPLRLRRRNP